MGSGNYVATFYLLAYFFPTMLHGNYMYSVKVNSMLAFTASALGTYAL